MVKAKFPGCPVMIGKRAEPRILRVRITWRSGSRRGDICCLINPDTVVQEDTIRVMLKFLRKPRTQVLQGAGS